jgi:hypothetical protein
MRMSKTHISAALRSLRSSCPLSIASMNLHWPELVLLDATRGCVCQSQHLGGETTLFSCLSHERARSPAAAAGVSASRLSSSVSMRRPCTPWKTTACSCLPSAALFSLVIALVCGGLWPWCGRSQCTICDDGCHGFPHVALLLLHLLCMPTASSWSMPCCALW